MSNKRSSIFKQGKPEDPYEDRDGPADPPRKATAAQMATRKIKSFKGARRPPGVNSGLSQSTNLGAIQSSGFSFGGDGVGFGDNSNTTGASNPFGSLAQASQSTANGGAFGSAATSSFPPAQSSTPSNSFANSSFPAFGNNNANTGFNPQPPSTGFSFSSGGASAFGAAASTPTINGSGSGGFSGSIFNIPPSQPAQSSNPFAISAQNTASTAAPSGGLFGTSAPVQNNMFGNVGSSAQNNDTPTTTTAPPSNPFAFGAQNTASTAATSGGLFGTGAPVQTAPVQNNMFGNIGSSAQNDNTTTTTAPPFPAGTLGIASTAAPSAGLFASNPLPQTNVFGNIGSSAQNNETITTTVPPSDNLFAGVPAASSTSANPPFGFGKFGKFGTFGSTSQAPPTTQESTSTFKPTLFGSIGSSAPQNDTATATASPNSAFANFPTASSASTNAPFSFGTPSNAAPTTQESTSTFKPTLFGTNSEANPEVSSTEAPASTTFAGFSAQNKIEPAKTSAPSFSLFSNASMGTQGESASTGPQAILAATPRAAGAWKKSQQQQTKKIPLPWEQSSPKQPQEQVFNIGTQNNTASLSSLDTPSSPSKEQPPPSPASMMPTLTGAAKPPPEAPKAAEIPKLPKVHVPKNWSAPKDGSSDPAVLVSQLAKLNENYRIKLLQLPSSADWSSLSLWHHKESSEIVRKFNAAKKQLAIAKGITGNESSLSTKRKADEEARLETQDISPSKKPRGDAPSTPTPKPTGLFSTTPQASPSAPSHTSNLFSSAINNKSTGSTSSSPFAPKTSEKNESEPSKESQSQARPSFGFGAPATTSSSKGFNFGAAGPKSGSSGTGGFLGAFAKSAKTAEQLREERKQKAKDDDFDSDDESEEQWSARWDKEEAEREAKEQEKNKAKATTGFSLSAPLKNSNTASSASDAFSFKPASGASTPGFLSSRIGSPAPSLGGSKSVFDTPEVAQTPSSNIFGHLSPAGSSNIQDEDDDDEVKDDQSDTESQSDEQSSEGAESQKRKFDQSESESEGTLEEVMRKKQNTSKKPSLADRMTKADESEKENNESEKEEDTSSKSSSLFGQANGVQTPAAKPFTFFDFGKAAAQSAPPKKDTFAGDQTFKAGTPIKFGTTAKSNPTFQFLPATPSPADFSATPSKPPPTTFSFLNPNSGQSGPGSIASSALSSRAPTPLSEAETSGKDSAAENEDGETQGDKQLNLSDLTAQEKEENDVLFHTEQALAKHQVEKDGNNDWENYARGALWVLKNKESGKAFVRMRLASGATMLNYNILPKLKTNVRGNSKTMVSTVGQKKDGKMGKICFAFKISEIAEEFSNVYNENVPS